MKNNQVLSSLAMDLLRLALGLNRGSYLMAKRFEKEALKREKEIDYQSLPPYMKKILSSLHNKIQISNLKKKAEDALMYSTIIQNYTLKAFK